jgi:integrase
MMESGLRKGKVIGLRVDNLNFEEETVTVLGKDKEEREVPMNRETIEAVKAYLEERPDSTSQQLFLKVNGEPLTPDGLASLMHRMKAQAELPQLNVKGSSPFTRSETRRCATTGGFTLSLRVPRRSVGNSQRRPYTFDFLPPILILMQNVLLRNSSILPGMLVQANHCR